MKGRRKVEFKDVLTDDIRISIINSLSEHPKTIRELEVSLNLNRGTLKHHLKILSEFKVIERDLENKKYHISNISTTKEKEMKGYLETLSQKKNKMMLQEDFLKLNMLSDIPTKILFSNPPLVDVIIKINKNGEEFIKEGKNEKK